MGGNFIFPVMRSKIIEQVLRAIKHLIVPTWNEAEMKYMHSVHYY